jgi:flagellar protein FlaG
LQGGGKLRANARPATAAGFYREVIMSIAAIAMGNAATTAPTAELPQEQMVLRHQAEDRARAFQKAAAVSPSMLPGNDTAELRSQAADMEQISMALNRKLKFTVDHQSHEVTVKVIDPETDKVIRILPPEELQRLHSKIQETIGFLFDERV